MPLEIERKFLLDRKILDFLGKTPFVEIEQSYLVTGETEVRVRKIETPFNPNNHYSKLVHEYKLTIKHGHGMVREEDENNISASTYVELSRLASCTIAKRRFTLEGFEIDEFKTPFTHVTAEFEMKTADEEVKIPDWMQPFFIKEITGDKKYSNFKLAQMATELKALSL